MDREQSFGMLLGVEKCQETAKCAVQSGDLCIFGGTWDIQLHSSSNILISFHCFMVNEDFELCSRCIVAAFFGINSSE